MANTTYLALTNKLIRRLNEVELTETDFTSTRGVQAMAKDAINASLAEINNQFFEWPFNYTQGTQVFVKGTYQYDFPANLKKIDWNSFHIQKNDTLGVKSKHLWFTSKDYWEDFYKDIDLDAGTDGVNIPIYVTPGNSYGFIVTPSPNNTYTVQFDYVRLFTPLDLFSDLSNIPANFDEVIIAGALYHFYMFRDNQQEYLEIKAYFKTQLMSMINIFGHQDDTMRSTVLPDTSSWSNPTYVGASGN